MRSYCTHRLDIMAGVISLRVTRSLKSLYRPLALLGLAVLLSGCEQLFSQLGIEDPVKKQAKQVAEGKAVGGACRHSGRAIEDCYSVYQWLPKEAIFDGWREMDAYMRENEITTIAPTLPPAPPPTEPSKKKKKKATAEAAPASEEKSESAPAEAAKH